MGEVERLRLVNWMGYLPVEVSKGARMVACWLFHSGFLLSPKTKTESPGCSEFKFRGRLSELVFSSAVF